MKFLIILISIFFSQILYAQKHPANSANVKVKGNQNIVTVNQWGTIVNYNLNIKTEANQFFDYLKSIPFINDLLKKIYNSVDNTNKVVKKILEKVNTKDFNPNVFAQLLEKYITENASLKAEIERYKADHDSKDFAMVYKKAKAFLDNYDNEGFQKLWEEFKTKKKREIEQDSQDIAQASFYQAKGNQGNYLFKEALIQINEALSYDKLNSLYLLTKGDILISLNKFDDAIAALQNIKSDAADSILVDTYNLLGFAFNQKMMPDSALGYLKSSHEINSRLKNPFSFRLVSNYLNLGEVYYNVGDINSSLDIYFYVKNLLTKACYSDTIFIANMLDEIGAAYAEKHSTYPAHNELDTSLQYLTNALNMLLKYRIRVNPLIALTYNHIGRDWGMKGIPQKQLFYAQEGVKYLYGMYDESDPVFETSFYNLTHAYIGINQLDSAYKYCKKYINITLSNYGENGSTGQGYQLLGAVYANMGKCDSAIHYLNKSIKIIKRTPGQYNLHEVNELLNKIQNNCRENYIQKEVTKQVGVRVRKYIESNGSIFEDIEALPELEGESSL